MDQRAWAVILAGGEGKRLRALTRFLSGEERPKQFCRLYGGKTLLAHTRSRLAPAIPAERTTFVVLKEHDRFYRAELPDVPHCRVIAQPRNRGTTAAIIAGLLRVRASAGDAVVGFFPTDHFYSNETAFLAWVQSSIRTATEQPYRVILLGATPDRAEVEYGWIEPDEDLNGRSIPVPVRRFWEKPSSVVAERLLARGCVWNTFVMIGRVSAFIDILRRTVPSLLAAFEAVPYSTESGFPTEPFHDLYAAIPTGDFSDEVLSICTDKLKVIRTDDTGWNDLGTPERVMDSIQRSQFAWDKMAHYEDLEKNCKVFVP